MSTIEVAQDQVLQVLEDEIRVLVPGDATQGRFEMFEITGPAGSGPPPHAHPWDEVFVIQEGEVYVELEGEGRIAGPGDTIIIPQGTVHTFEIRDGGAKFLSTTTGAGASQFFADLSQTVGAVAPTPEHLGPIVEVAKRNGLTSPLF